MKKVILILGLIASQAKAQYSFQDDKKLHMMAGATIGATSYVVSFNYLKAKKVHNPYIKAVGIGLGTSVLAAFAKEQYDKRILVANGNWNNVTRNDRDQDIACTIFGAMSVNIVIDLFNKK